ncbi:MAG: hypothetical protein ACRC8Y_02020 [Chroococcales cyanobacterium]
MYQEKYSVMSLTHPDGSYVYLVGHEFYENSPKYKEIKAQYHSGEKTIREIWPKLKEAREQFKDSDRRIIVSRDRSKAKQYEIYPRKSYDRLQQMMKDGRFVEV